MVYNIYNKWLEREKHIMSLLIVAREKKIKKGRNLATKQKLFKNIYSIKTRHTFYLHFLIKNLKQSKQQVTNSKPVLKLQSSSALLSHHNSCKTIFMSTYKYRDKYM